MSLSWSIDPGRVDRAGSERSVLLQSYASFTNAEPFRITRRHRTSNWPLVVPHDVRR
jgi:hypothetical protein